MTARPTPSPAPGRIRTDTERLRTEAQALVAEQKAWAYSTGEFWPRSVTTRLVTRPNSEPPPAQRRISLRGGLVRVAVGPLRGAFISKHLTSATRGHVQPQVRGRSTNCGEPSTRGTCTSSDGFWLDSPTSVDVTARTRPPMSTSADMSHAAPGRRRRQPRFHRPACGDSARRLAS
jgi:hypothetical protein